MRTYFEPEDTDAFESAKALLIRRCMVWAKRQGRELDPMALDTMLNFRHNSIDGRLGYWTTGLVEEFLLSHTPRTLSANARDVAHIPEDLRLLVRYLHATGLADPTGDPQDHLDAAITKAGNEFPAAMADERNFGVAKFWAMNALRRGADLADGAAMAGFLDDARMGRVDYDDGVLAEIAARHVLDGGGRPERAVVQLPVSLPPDAELAAAAERTPVVARLRGLVEWVGEGRALTPSGNLKLADARELVTLLDTGDRFDPRIGDRVYRTQSSADLPVLSSLVGLAKRIRVVRVVRGKLVRVAKNARLLGDSLALWTAAFGELPSPELVTQGGHWPPEHTTLLSVLIDEVLADLLNTLYGLPEPMPVVRLEAGVWLSLNEAFDPDDLDAASETVWRKGVGTDLRRLLATLADFGAVELTTAEPDPVFRADLGFDQGVAPDQVAPFPPDMLDRLRAALRPGAGPMELVSLTPLATRAVRARLVEEGRHAPLVGELAGAEPGPMLGMLSEHYSPETAADEVAGWLAAHGGRDRGLPQLLDAIRGCPFRTRATAMLDMLSHTVPDRCALLRNLRSDRHLGPIATHLLVEDGELAMEELGEEEGLRGMAEQLIHLLEAGGPDAVADALAESPPDEARGLMAALSASGHPDETGLEELRELFAARRPGLATVHPLAGTSRASRNARGKGRKRRR
ncbi:hypothetical protein [Prauserella endophytica]|uniref:Helicase XPB/Ssl2 N-terminal domain-containing protein n=1 Tax=Prauserella endophytica TaxID=1592324 RepID=A0ABY2RU23_9PSEU|nr:hypothetical protein [Prauserella endophytica]TKG60526.1 hypothetical protein FCN18_35250 [Prauserella endophytica]